MEDKLQLVFDKIHAEDALKEKTADFLHTEIQKRSQIRKRSRMRIAIACVSFVLFMLTGGGFSYNLYFTPGAYVDMDVNPSVELTLNRFGRVLEASPYNDDGTAALKGLDLRYKTYEEAVRKLLEAMNAQGYLKPNSLVSVTVQSGNADLEKNMLSGLQTAVSSSLASQRSSATTSIFAVSREVKECAHDYDLSPAKYIAITELQAVDPTATFEGFAEHSISEIKQQTKEHGEGHHKETSPESGKINSKSAEDDGEVEKENTEQSKNTSNESGEIPSTKSESNNEHGNDTHH